MNFKDILPKISTERNAPLSIDHLNVIWTGVQFDGTTQYREDWVCGTIQFICDSPFIDRNEPQAFWVADDNSFTDYIPLSVLEAMF